MKVLEINDYFCQFILFSISLVKDKYFIFAVNHFPIPW